MMQNWRQLDGVGRMQRLEIRRNGISIAVRAAQGRLVESVPGNEILVYSRGFNSYPTAKSIVTDLLTEFIPTYQGGLQLGENPGDSTIYFGPVVRRRTHESSPTNSRILRDPTLID
ncbi:hypothetical protein BDR07DRAFT_494381 [Suillus spraguei]|nr:hypothetical protein BDR07DRAFT_494381 [Suillus spraguei]